VVVGVIGIWLGFPLADPIVGLVIAAAIVVLLIGTSRDIGRRLLDGIDPGLVDKAQQTVASIPGIDTVDDLRMRWSGHRLMVEATVSSDPAMPVGQFHELEHQAVELLRDRLPRLDTVRLIPAAHPGGHIHP
jgi:divalent metal cation (Fe/Co/Zn/Cd) transporter